MRHTTVSDAAWIDATVAAGMPALYAHRFFGMFQAPRRGDFAATDPSLTMLLGRPPLTMRDILKAATM